MPNKSFKFPSGGNMIFGIHLFANSQLGSVGRRRSIFLVKIRFTPRAQRFAHRECGESPTSSPCFGGIWFNDLPSDRIAQNKALRSWLCRGFAANDSQSFALRNPATLRFSAGDGGEPQSFALRNP